jgi:hypothetical protein
MGPPVIYDTLSKLVPRELRKLMTDLAALFWELGFPQDLPTVVYCDNQGTVACSHDPHSHSRMKHIDIRLHFVRDCVNNRIIDVHHIPGIQNSADLFTKNLDKVIH